MKKIINCFLMTLFLYSIAGILVSIGELNVVLFKGDTLGEVTAKIFPTNLHWLVYLLLIMPISFLGIRSLIISEKENLHLLEEKLTAWYELHQTIDENQTMNKAAKEKAVSSQSDATSELMASMMFAERTIHNIERMHYCTAGIAETKKEIEKQKKNFWILLGRIFFYFKYVLLYCHE